MQITIQNLYDNIKTFKQRHKSCPSCNTSLQKEPKRKSICKKCQEPIFVVHSIVHRDVILMNTSQQETYNQFLSIFNKVKTGHCQMLADGGTLAYNYAEIPYDFENIGARFSVHRTFSHVIFESGKARYEKNITAVLFYKWHEFFILFMECLFDEALKIIPTILTLSSVASIGTAEQEIQPYEFIAKNNLQTNLSVINIMAINAIVTDLHEFGLYFFDCQDDWLLRSLDLCNTTKSNVMTWFVGQCQKHKDVFYNDNAN